MCAIFGIIGEYESKSAKQALTLLAHRGPNHCGIIEQPNLFFAHHRLSIQDSHHRSHQPYGKDNIYISFNGEIYNFESLKNELDFSFETNSDTEVIYALYLRYKEDFVEHLRGMFAIAIYDHGKLLLFRDRLGKKPLFYLQTPKAFYFASELKALKVFLDKVQMDENAMLSYLGYLAPTFDLTFYKGIKKLPPGYMAVYEKHNLEVKRYYNLLDTTPNHITTKDEALQKLEQTLEEAMFLRLKTQTPTATLLSGGIDSATINYYAKKFGFSYPAFSLGFDEYLKYDELQKAKESAKLLGLQEHRAIVTNKTEFIESFETVFDALDEPLNDPAAIPLHILFKHIKKEGYKVVLSGEGNDELFLGYRQYFEYIELEKAKELYHANWLKKYFRSNFSMNREWEWYKRAFEKEVIFRCCSEKFTDMQKNHLLRRNVRDGEGMQYIQKYRDDFESSKHTDESIWYSYVDLSHFQAEHFLVKLDRVSMHHSIESRTPFLDHKFVELVFSLKPSLRYESKITKGLFKELMHNKLDPIIINRKKKGFSNPYMEYLIASGEIAIIEEVNEKTGLFKKDVLERYIATAKKGTFKQHIWGLYVLAKWIKKELL